jgi:hypothetical protein
MLNANPAPFHLLPLFDMPPPVKTRLPAPPLTTLVEALLLVLLNSIAKVVIPATVFV